MWDTSRYFGYNEESDATVNKKSVVLIGDRGMLGSEIKHLLKEMGFTVIGLNTGNCDIASLRVGEYVDLADIYSVVCTAAMFGPSQYNERLMNVNAVGPVSVAREIYPKRFHFISTDYVFSRGSGFAYTNTEQTPTCAYGFSKMVAESLLVGGRTVSTIYRCGPMFGINHCRGKSTRNVIDQMIVSALVDCDCYWTSGESNITYARNAATFICAEVDADRDDKFRIYHTIQTGDYSLYEVARFIYTKLGVDANKVHYSSEYQHGRLYPCDKMLNWKDAIMMYMEELGYAVN